MAKYTQNASTGPSPERSKYEISSQPSSVSIKQTGALKYNYISRSFARSSIVSNVKLLGLDPYLSIKSMASTLVSQAKSKQRSNIEPKKTRREGGGGGRRSDLTTIDNQMT